ncbi:GPW/gp25 family protein [Kribbella ginsengisoli]|uniref:GPW/gp25 family protein n=1 Tax=Kribbella ginsengisoli TaxID=363865 RepID=A0ABP6WNJ2_9ACTN
MTTQAVAGLRFPLEGATGRLGFARGIDKLEQCIRLVLLTYPGERVMRPDFGCRLRDFLFEAATPATMVRIADEIEQAIAACEPRVEVRQVEVTPDEAVDGLLHIAIHYRPVDESEPVVIVVDFATDRHPAAAEVA